MRLKEICSRLCDKLQHCFFPERKSTSGLNEDQLLQEEIRNSTSLSVKFEAKRTRRRKEERE